MKIGDKAFFSFWEDSRAVTSAKSGKGSLGESHGNCSNASRN